MCIALSSLNLISWSTSNSGGGGSTEAEQRKTTVAWNRDNEELFVNSIAPMRLDELKESPNKALGDQTLNNELKTVKGK